MGEWYYPNGTVVPTHHAGNDFYRLRNSPQAIKLARRIHSDGSGALGPTGLYCCVIPTTIGEQRFCALIRKSTQIDMIYLLKFKVRRWVGITLAPCSQFIVFG